MNGKVKFFNESKGFGFIAGDDGKEYFMHLSSITPGTKLVENDAVTFDVTQGDRGPKAANVKKAAGAPDNAPAEDSDDAGSEAEDDESA